MASVRMCPCFPTGSGLCARSWLSKTPRWSRVVCEACGPDGEDGDDSARKGQEGRCPPPPLLRLLPRDVPSAMHESFACKKKISPTRVDSEGTVGVRLDIALGRSVGMIGVWEPGSRCAETKRDRGHPPLSSSQGSGHPRPMGDRGPPSPSCWGQGVRRRRRQPHHQRRP